METQTHNAGPTSTQGSLKQLENFFDTYLNKKAPFRLPADAKEWVVKLIPWATLVVMVWALQVLWYAYKMVQYADTYRNSVYGSYYANYNLGPVFYVASLLTVIALIMQAVALPKLFARILKGWEMLYYSSMVAAVAELISGNILGAIVGLAIVLYFLFQVKESYK